MLYLVLLFIFTLVVEILINVHMIAVARAKRLPASFLSASIEPVKLLSVLIVIGSDNKLIAVLICSVACFIGTFLAITWSKK
jgi:hypothetical protein